MSTFVNSQFLNFQQGSLRITAIGENKTSGIGTFYSTLVDVMGTGLSLPIGTIKNAAREMGDIFYKTGDYAGTTTKNQILNEMTTSLTMAYDGVYFGSQRIANTFTKNILLAIMKGEAFKDGSDIIKVVGTNGTRKLATAIPNNAFKYLLWNDGKMSDPQSDDGTGVPIRSNNIRVPAYNKFANCIMIEFLWDNGDVKEGLRYVYAIPSKSTIADDDDYAKISVDFTLLCDSLFIDDFYINGLSVGDVVSGAPTVATNINAIKTDYIFSTDTLSTSAVVSNGVTGEMFTLVDAATKKVQVYRVTGAAIAIAIDKDYNLVAGCLITAPKYKALTNAVGVTTIDFAPATLLATANHKFVAIGTAGNADAVAPTAVAVSELINTTATTPGTPLGIFSAKDFDFATMAWVAN